MQTRTIVISIVVLILIVLGVWYAMGMSGNSSLLGTGATTTNEVASTTAGTTSGTSGSNTATTGGTLHSIASQTNNFTCTVTAGGPSGQATGVIFGAGGKVRVDISIPSNNGSVTSHVIRSNGFAYSWVDGQSTGTKTAVTTSSNLTAPGQGGVISLDSATASECHPWSPDTAQFTPPKGITFVAR